MRCGAGQLLRAGCARSTSTLLLDIMSALDLHRQWLSLHLMLPWHVQVESLTGKSWLVGGWKRSVQVGRQHVHCAGRWLSAPGRHCRSRQAHQTISGGRAAAWITFLPPAGAHLVCRGDQEDADREGQPGAVQYCSRGAPACLTAACATCNHRSCWRRAAAGAAHPTSARVPVLGAG